jgi:hypothetical protein
MCDTTGSVINIATMKERQISTTSTLICSTEILTLSRKHEQRVETADIKLLRIVARYTLQDQLMRIKKELTNCTGQSPV